MKLPICSIKHPKWPNIVRSGVKQLNKKQNLNTKQNKTVLFEISRFWNKEQKARLRKVVICLKNYLKLPTANEKFRNNCFNWRWKKLSSLYRVATIILINKVEFVTGSEVLTLFDSNKASKQWERTREPIVLMESYGTGALLTDRFTIRPLCSYFKQWHRFSSTDHMNHVYLVRPWTWRIFTNLDYYVIRKIAYGFRENWKRVKVNMGAKHLKKDELNQLSCSSHYILRRKQLLFWRRITKRAVS